MKAEVLMHNRHGENMDPNGEPRKAELPWQGCEWLKVEGKCRKCNAEPLRVKGDKRTQTEGPDALFAVAYCFDCNQPIGTLKVFRQTIFGEEEDERVLRGRPRVY